MHRTAPYLRSSVHRIHIVRKDTQYYNKSSLYCVQYVVKISGGGTNYTLSGYHQCGINWFDLYIRPVVRILNSELCASGNVFLKCLYVNLYIYIRWTVIYGWRYTHDRLADKNPYPHDRRADKNSYPHDRNVTDDLCSLIKLCFAFIMVNFST